jgi:hypothetical protein
MGYLGVLPYGMSLLYHRVALMPTLHPNDADQQDFTCMWYSQNFLIHLFERRDLLPTLIHLLDVSGLC